MAATATYRIRKGDTVEVIGGKDRGKRGKVLRVVPAMRRAVVEGINRHKRHRRPRAVGQPAGIIEFDAPISVSKVMLVCPKCGQRARIGYQVGADGTKRRTCRACNETIDE